MSKGKLFVRPSIPRLGAFLLSALIGVVATNLYHSLGQARSGEVRVHFVECVGDVAVYTFENETNQPVWARFDHPPHLYGELYSSADAVICLHSVYYWPPNSSDANDVSNQWDCIMSFREVPPGGSIRFGVDLKDRAARLQLPAGGEYQVGVPFMVDKSIVDLLESWPRTEGDYDRIGAAWQECRSVRQSCTCE